jgi:NAD(P)-dependent dehydrogenase (short-subunit alcohol dehydrogenase family)
MDAIIHNAGVYTERSRGSTPEGHASTLAINTLAPYMLTALIERPGRLVYLSSGLHRGGEGSLDDLDWTKRSWDSGKAYAESKLHVVALASAMARRWPQVLSNAVDPGWARTRMGGPGAPVDVDTGQRTQTWLAVSEDPGRPPLHRGHPDEMRACFRVRSGRTSAPLGLPALTTRRSSSLPLAIPAHRARASAVS